MRAGTKTLSSSTSGVKAAMNSSRVEAFVATLQIRNRPSPDPEFGAEPPGANGLGVEGSEDDIRTRPPIIRPFPPPVQRKGLPPIIPACPGAAPGALAPQVRYQPKREEREGFEPSERCRSHDFQSCAFDHSAISPNPLHSPPPRPPIDRPPTP